MEAYFCLVSAAEKNMIFNVIVELIKNSSFNYLNHLETLSSFQTYII